MLYPKRTRWKIAAAAVGILAATVPLVLFNGWIRWQGSDEAAVTAAWALGSTEVKLGQAVATLKDLAARGVDSCAPVHIEAMRQAVLHTGPIKGLMLVAPDGQVVCTDSAALAGRQQILSSASTGSPDLMLDAIRLPDRGERFLRIRRIGQPGKPGMAALVSANLLLPQASMQGGRAPGVARLLMADGTPLGDMGAAADYPPDAQFSARLRSNQYRLAVAVSMPQSGVIATRDDLSRIGMVVSGVLALIVLFFASLYRWRGTVNPVADLAKAILSEEFVPYFQPVVDIQTGRLLGAEVLVRWRRSDGSFVEPNAFVALIETSGLAFELTRSLMRRVLADLGEAVGKRPRLTIAFNVTPQHFDDALILNDIGTIFDGSPIKLRQLVLEVTERHEVENLASMRRTIAALQGMGCKIAIDDVGTGHSGLSYILKLGVDIIKIDKMFVESIGSDGHSKAIIETLIDLAKNMRMEIIAEGVETFDQVTYLRERGIGAAQGYVFAPPLPAASFLQLLEAMDPVAEAAAPVRGKPRIVRAARGIVAKAAV